MIKKLWRSFIGCVKWVLWLVAFAFLLNVFLLGGLLVTPVMFFFFWKARSTAEVFDVVADRLADRISEEFKKYEWKDVEFEMDFGDDDEENDM